MPSTGAVHLAGDATFRTLPSSNLSSDGIAFTGCAVVISPTMWFKTRSSALGDFEQLILLGVLRLDEDAYGAAIRQEIHARSGRDVSINAVYTTLDRLERKGLLRSWVGEPTAAAWRTAAEILRLPPVGHGGAPPGISLLYGDGRGARRAA